MTSALPFAKARIGSKGARLGVKLHKRPWGLIANPSDVENAVSVYFVAARANEDAVSEPH